MNQDSPFNAQLRIRLFRPLFLTGVAGALLYLLLGLLPFGATWIRTAIYPWDGVCVNGMSLWSGWLLRRSLVPADDDGPAAEN